jgi:hypothetical protein
MLLLFIIHIIVNRRFENDNFTQQKKNEYSRKRVIIILHHTNYNINSNNKNKNKHRNNNNNNNNNHNTNNRLVKPSFKDSEKWFGSLKMHLEVGCNIKSSN